MTTACCNKSSLTDFAKFLILEIAIWSLLPNSQYSMVKMS